jgi:nucleotide-binding universal stress UspA family protein
MSDKILYAVNFEEHEPELMSCLAELCAAGGQEILLAHFSNTQRVLRHLPVLLRDEAGESLAAISRSKLDEMAGLARERGVPVRTIIENADLAWIGTCELAQRERPFLIVAGPVVGTELGHTIYFMMHGARTPLLVVKRPVDAAQGPGEEHCRGLVQRILYPTDWSRPARRAQELILSLRTMGAQEVIVLHVLDKASADTPASEQREDYHHQVARQLSTTSRIFENAGLRSKTLMVEGSAAQEIESVALKEDASLIVMGSTGKSVSEEMTVGSVSERVARSTDRSILLAYPA